MPEYVLQCEECGERVKVRLSFEDDKPDVCQGCGGKLRRIWFAPVVYWPTRAIRERDGIWD